MISFVWKNNLNVTTRGQIEMNWKIRKTQNFSLAGGDLLSLINSR